MAKTCITTLVNSWYTGFEEMFKYSAKKAMPQTDIKIFHADKLFPGFHGSSVNSLRFFVPEKEFSGYDFVYFTDIDFIFLERDKTLFDYHHKIAEFTRQGCSYHRGPIKARGKAVDMWVGQNTRIAAGAVMVNRDWFIRTRTARRRLLPTLKSGVKFREYDETVLYKIFHDAGYTIPQRMGRFCDGRKYNIKYRDLHLGDFKPNFTRWKRIKRMRRKFLTDDNIMLYEKMRQTPEWQEVVKKSCENEHIRKIINNLNWHMHKRLKCIYAS